MLYAAVFRRFPNIRFVVAHCGGGLPALSSRLLLLGLENWVQNPEKLTYSEMKAHMRRLFLDTAGTMPTGPAPALLMTTPDHIVYGSDSGVPCTTNGTMDVNLEALLAFRGLSSKEIEAIGGKTGHSNSATSVANDLGYVKTPLGITAPAILSPVVMRRAAKRKNSSSARHYDQIRFRFRTAKTHQRHCPRR